MQFSKDYVKNKVNKKKMINRSGHIKSKTQILTIERKSAKNRNNKTNHTSNLES